MPDPLNHTPQTRSAYTKALTLLFGVLMILGTLGFWAYGDRVRKQVTGAMNMAATLSPRRFVPAELLAKKIELDEAEKTSRSEADSQFATLLKEHPVFGAPPEAGPPQAVITGILGDMALINNKWMKVGETQAGVKLVMTMTSGRAMVEIEGKQREINIFTNMPNKPLPPGPASLSGGGGGGGSDRGRDRSDRGGSGGNSTYQALRDAFSSKKDIRDNKELMGRLSKMDNKDIYQLYQKAKASGVPMPYSDEEINTFFKQGGFKNKKVYDEMENRNSGSGRSEIPFGGSKSSKAEKKPNKLDPERLAELKAAKAARDSESGPSQPSVSEKSGLSGSPNKSSGGPSFGPPERSGKGPKTKKGRKRGNERNSMPSGPSYTPPKIAPAPPIAPFPSQSSGMGSSFSGPSSAGPKSKSKPIYSPPPSPSGSLSPKIPKSLDRSSGISGGSSRSDRPSPSELRSKPGGSNSGSSRPDRPSPSELRSKPGGSNSGSSRPDGPSPSELRTKPGGSSSGSPRPGGLTPGELRSKPGGSPGGSSGSSKGPRSFYPGSPKSKSGSSGFSGPSGAGGPKGKKGSRKVQNPYRNNE